jgi:hypothetical protein
MNNETPGQLDPPQKDIDQQEPPNPYLELSFWRFALVATFVTAFLPWSLLANLLLKGLADTKLLIAALLRDYLQTLLAIALGVVVLVVGVVAALFYFWPLIVDVVIGLWTSFTALF